MAQELHCEVPCKPANEALADLHKKANSKTPLAWFIPCLVAGVIAVGSVYLAMFACSATSSANDFATRSQINVLEVSTTREIEQIKGEQKSFLTRLDGLTAAIKENTEALRSHTSQGGS